MLLMRTEACGLGTDLPHINSVILHDSDWDPRQASAVTFLTRV